jgi:hypothetical protein
MYSAVQAEKEEILDSIREISRDIKLKDLIIASFIPPQYQDKIVKHAHWDDYDAAWTIDVHSLAGNSVRGQRELASMQQAQMQPAYIPAGTTSNIAGQQLVAVKIHQFTLKFQSNSGEALCRRSQPGGCILLL